MIDLILLTGGFLIAGIMVTLWTWAISKLLPTVFLDLMAWCALCALYAFISISVFGMFNSDIPAEYIIIIALVSLIAAGVMKR